MNKTDKFLLEFFKLTLGLVNFWSKGAGATGA